MAYFSRNGFTPVKESNTASFISGLQHEVIVTANVKDVKYAKRNGTEKEEINTNRIAKEGQLETVMRYSKCLIHNLLNLSAHQLVERNSFMELTATWSQFVRWYALQHSAVDFSHHDLMVELDQKLCAQAKAHRQSDLIEVVLSERIKDQLQDSLNEMMHVRSIRFGAIRF